MEMIVIGLFELSWGKSGWFVITFFVVLFLILLQRTCCHGRTMLRL